MASTLSACGASGDFAIIFPHWRSKGLDKNGDELLYLKLGMMPATTSRKWRGKHHTKGWLLYSKGNCDDDDDDDYGGEMLLDRNWMEGGKAGF